VPLRSQTVDTASAVLAETQEVVMLNKVMRVSVSEDSYKLLEIAAESFWQSLRPFYCNDDALAGKIMQDLDELATLRKLNLVQQLFAAVLMTALCNRGYACARSYRVVQMPVAA